MLARVLFVLLPLVFSFNSDAKLKLNLENQKDFLNSLYDDFEVKLADIFERVK